MPAIEWDLFCRVVDNFGDAGVCWRLAADLASRGQPVRLWIDDPSPLAWMAPGGAAGVSVLAWPAAAAGEHDLPVAPGPVVIEAFGCDLPPRFLAAMAAMARPPVWIDLEYLSAEDYVERSHRLPSPQTIGPAAGLVRHFLVRHFLVRHFFYPGFTADTGGLIREPALAVEQPAFDAAAWLGRLGLERLPGERMVSLFCYEQPALAALLDRLAEAPTLLLLTPGAAARQAGRSLAESPRHPRLRTAELPWLTQPDYDRLLWACDLNFVRGEDSFVRAQWAGAPFVWQAYPQAEHRHQAKVEAFLRRLLAGIDPAIAGPVRQLWSVWNGAAAATPLPWPPAGAWGQLCGDWRDGLRAQPDLTSRLMRFVTEIGARSG